ncbi:transglutaminase domain-containing protein [Scytonema sp. HK-05]|nr:hypothetical protein NIES2130_24205 [Scytonema sp. HK-05]BAY45565.1 transglutaminase domain-containing protein [Scytonema sp. HK-05]
MLAALGAFFGRLFGELNDMRLALAELLIQLQVFHSFDMPRRKDLGYSIVIGLILLGVVATLSQTFAFAPVLLLFLAIAQGALRCFAIALPTLVLEYRSRLGLQPLKLFSGFAWEQDKNQKLPSNFFTFYWLFNDNFYYGFNSSMSQNLQGVMKPKVVMRVRSPQRGGRFAPLLGAGFWRVLAFDRYTGQGWEISGNEQVQTLKRSPCRYQIIFSLAPIFG